MDFDPKTLEKLAKACRKAGIKHFKNATLEFTLTDEVPPSNYKKRQKASPKVPHSSTSDDLIETDSLTETQLLLWSAGGDFQEN